MSYRGTSLDDWWENRAEVMKAFPPVLPTRTQTMAGPGQTNWVIKNHVLCGGHPGSNPADMVKNLKSILEAGVTTFVCLQHDMVAPNITLGGASVSSRSRSAFGDGVVVRAKPYIQDAQLIAERAGMPQVTPARPLSFLHLPIPDTSGATVSDATLSDFVLMLFAHIKAGEMLYVQCSDGNGRTGMISALLLGLAYHLSSSEALDLTQRYRDNRAGTAGLSPETHEQKMAVHRLLGQDGFRAAADGIAPAGVGTMLAGDVLSAVMLNVKQQLNDKGQVSFIRLAEAARASLSHNVTSTTLPQLFAWLSTEGIRLTDDELSVLMSAFPAATGRHAMNVTSFIEALRGELSTQRRDVVLHAFRCLPLSSAGDIDVSALAKLHNARNHPRVKSGRRTEKEVADEFLRTIRPRGGRTGKISLHEFQEYYTDISASVLDDNAFQLLLWSVWPLKSKVSDDAAGVASVGGSTALPMQQTASKDLTLEEALSVLRRAGQNVGEWAFPKLKLGLLHSDKNGDGRVTLTEFEEALGFARFIFTKIELGDVFRALGPQGNSIPIELILSVAQEPLSSFRRRLIVAAFSGLDTRDVGSVSVDHVLSSFHALKHPTVAANRRSEYDVRNDFQTTFTCDVTDARIRLNVFERYYELVSAGLESDDEFELIVWNCWRLGAKKASLPGPASSIREESDKSRVSLLPDGEDEDVARLRGKVGKVGVTRRAASIDDIHTRIRGTCATKGLSGVIKLEGRLVAASGGDPNLACQTLVEVLREFGTDLSQDEFITLLRHHDPSRSGSVDARSFLSTISGALNSTRAGLVKAVYQQLGSPGQSFVSIDALRARYVPSQHPDVKSGRITAGEALKEMLVGVDTAQDGQITLEDFSEYYTCVSAMIEDDNFFQMLMWNTWNIRTTSSVSDRKGGMAGVASIHQRTEDPWGRPLPAPTSSSSAPRVSVADTLTRVRNTLKRQGTQALINLRKYFYDVSRDEAGSLSEADLSKLFNAFDVSLSEAELETIFRGFDVDGNRRVSFHEFLRGVQGEMSRQRADVVHKAFQKIDLDNRGIVSMEDVALCFNASEDPDVKSGKYNARAALRMFLESFRGFDGDGTITAEEFEDYYASVSAMVDSDSYFYLAVWNTWQLDRPNPKLGVPVVPIRPSPKTPLGGDPGLRTGSMTSRR